MLIAHYFLSQTLNTKCVRSPEIQKSAAAKMDANGNIHAGNISAYWIPQITLQREIGGTVYTVTGYYEGKTDFLRKLERMTVDRMRRAMEDDIDEQIIKPLIQYP